MNRIVIGSRNRVLASEGTRYVSGAALVTDFAAHAREFETAEAVLWSWYALDESGRPDLAASLRGTEAILARLAPYRLPGIFLSTDAVFNGLDGGYTEEDTTDPQTDYARIKLAQEALMADFARLRFTTFGPSYSATRPLLLEMIAGGAVTFDRPRQCFSPISTLSLNRTIGEILAAGTNPRVYHLTSEPIAKSECCARLAQAIGVPAPRPETIDDTQLDLSLKSRTHNFPIADEICLAAAEWEYRWGQRGLFSVLA